MSLSFRKPRSATARAALAGATLAWPILGSVVLVVPKAHAANWDFNPRVEVGAEYDDNYRLAPSGQGKISA
jgi:hypothetical protein